MKLALLVSSVAIAGTGIAAYGPGDLSPFSLKSNAASPRYLDTSKARRRWWRRRSPCRLVSLSAERGDRVEKGHPAVRHRHHAGRSRSRAHLRTLAEFQARLQQPADRQANGGAGRHSRPAPPGSRGHPGRRRGRSRSPERAGGAEHRLASRLRSGLRPGGQLRRPSGRPGRPRTRWRPPAARQPRDRCRRRDGRAAAGSACPREEPARRADAYVAPEVRRWSRTPSSTLANGCRRVRRSCRCCPTSADKGALLRTGSPRSPRRGAGTRIRFSCDGCPPGLGAYHRSSILPHRVPAAGQSRFRGNLPRAGAGIVAAPRPHRSLRRYRREAGAGRRRRRARLRRYHQHHRDRQDLGAPQRVRAAGRQGARQGRSRAVPCRARSRHGGERGGGGAAGGGQSRLPPDPAELGGAGGAA